MTGFHVVLDGDGHLVSEGETVAEFRDRFDRDPEGGVVVLEEDGTPWRCLYPDYKIREDADPSTQAYLLDELGDDHYIGNQIREDLQSERSERVAVTAVDETVAIPVLPGDTHPRVDSATLDQGLPALQ